MAKFKCTGGKDYFIDFDDSTHISEMDVTCTINGTWMTTLSLPNFCPEGKSNCRLPNFPYCEDRTVLCKDGIEIPSDMIATPLATNQGNEMQGREGDVFVVSCKEEGDVIAMEDKFIESLEATCSKPTDYLSNWKDEKWLEGVWTGLDALKTCMSPTKCYYDPPNLPLDGTVVYNKSSQLHSVGETILYECSRPCKAYLKKMVKYEYLKEFKFFLGRLGL